MTRRRYEIKVDPHARKALDAMDKPIRRRIVAKIEGLAVDPRPGIPALTSGASRPAR